MLAPSGFQTRSVINFSFFLRPKKRKRARRRFDAKKRNASNAKKPRDSTTRRTTGNGNDEIGEQPARTSNRLFLRLGKHRFYFFSPSPSLELLFTFTKSRCKSGWRLDINKVGIFV